MGEHGFYGWVGLSDPGLGLWISPKVALEYLEGKNGKANLGLGVRYLPYRTARDPVGLIHPDDVKKFLGKLMVYRAPKKNEKPR